MRPYAAGVYEYGETGSYRVEWSRHSTPGLAYQAARKYRKRLQDSGPAAGGADSWSAWYDDGSRIIRVGGE